LVDYAKVTGIDLSNNPFAAAIERANSPGAILELLQEREKAFKDYREGNRKLISCLSPAVNVIQAFSGVLGEAVSLVSHTYHMVALLTRPRQVPFPPAKALFVGIDVLLSVRHFNTLLASSLLIDEFSRPPVGSRRVMMPSWTSLSAWGISSSVWRFIRQSRPLR
jgi:fungal STAND N-terminal Goodbye domain